MAKEMRRLCVLSCETKCLLRKNVIFHEQKGHDKEFQHKISTQEPKGKRDQGLNRIKKRNQQKKTDYILRRDEKRHPSN